MNLRNDKLLFLIIWTSANVLLGCTSIHQVLSPNNHADTSYLQQSQSEPGNAYSYEHKIRAEIFLGRGESRNAALEYAKAIAGAPENDQLRVQYARTLLQLRQFERARIQIAKTILLNPANGFAWASLAVYYEQKHNFPKAVAAATYGAQIDRKDIFCLQWLAHYYEQKSIPENKKQALHYYQLALVRTQIEPELFLAAGKICVQLKYHQLAAYYFEKYLHLWGKDTDAIEALVRYYHSNKQPLAAISLLHQCLERTPQKTRLRVILIQTLLCTHQFQHAKDHLLELSITNLNTQEIAQRAQWFLQAHAPFEAKQFLVDQCGNNPRKSAIRIQLVHTELALGRKEAAYLLLTEHPQGEWPTKYTQQVETLIKQF